MRYSEGKQYHAKRYGNTTQPMMPKVIVTPSLDTARKSLANLRVNLTLGINTQIYAAKITDILAAYPELATE